jgi:adenine/guanine phosphoribosyltransferase-like PRPP-binding protein
VRAKLYRFAVPTTDYGTADEAGRRALLADERISGIPDLFADRDVVVVDDLWVTGLSAEVTIDAIEGWKPRSVT